MAISNTLPTFSVTIRTAITTTASATARSSALLLSRSATKEDRNSGAGTVSTVVWNGVHASCPGVQINADIFKAVQYRSSLLLETASAGSSPQTRSYKPSAGDVIFFDWGGDGSPDHVGLVEKCDGRTVYTIEGNSSDTCRRRSYPVGGRQIYGYGIPKY